MNDPLSIEINWEVLQDGAPLNVAYRLYNEQGVCLFGSVPTGEALGCGESLPAGVYASKCEVPGHLFNTGVCRVHLLIAENGSRVLLQVEDFLVFEVLDSPDTRGSYMGKRMGVIRPQTHWHTERAESGGTQ